jgi:hypothetical protein
MPKDKYVYRFTGEYGPEQFLAFGHLEPGAVVESDEPVEHARLKLLSGPDKEPRPTKPRASRPRLAQTPVEPEPAKSLAPSPESPQSAAQEEK